jgi:protein SMG7
MQNRQSYAQLQGNTKVSPAKTVLPRSTGRSRGRGEVRFQPKDTTMEIAARDRECSVPDTLKAFYVRFVRLNGILFTRTRYSAHPCLIECVTFKPAFGG